MGLIFAILLLWHILVLNLLQSFGFGCGTEESISHLQIILSTAVLLLIFAVKPITVLGMPLGA